MMATNNTLSADAMEQWARRAARRDGLMQQPTG